MDANLLLVIAYFASFSALIVGFLLYQRGWLFRSSSPVDASSTAAAVDPQQRRRGRGAGRERMRQQQQRAAGAAADDADEMGEDDNEEAPPIDRREERRQQRRAQLEAEERQRERKAEKQNKYEEKLQARQEERERREKQEQEERLKRKEEEMRQVEKEYAEWKELICVEDAGSGGDTETDDGLLQSFIQAIQRRKVVALEDLAAEFSLPDAQAVVERIHTLEESGQLSGLVDDRGKYIYITPDEMEQVVAFLQSRGRVSIDDVVAHSNLLINLAGEQEEVSEVAFADSDDEEKEIDSP